MYRIFVVEDDPVIARVVQGHLQQCGYEVVCAEDFGDILPAFTAFAPQLVLLDLSLPFHNGYHWCREIRKLSPVPVVFLSSAAEGLNIVTAMDLGADDFIAKPFDLEVLTAKVQAILRRAYQMAAPGTVLSAGGAVLDLSAGTLKVNGAPVELTKNELRILQALLEQRGHVVSRDALMTRLWATDCFVDENTLTVNVGRLRKKLDAAGLGGLITTKKGTGYLVE